MKYNDQVRSRFGSAFQQLCQWGMAALTALFLAGLTCGCKTTQSQPLLRTEDKIEPSLARAELLFRQEEYTRALLECVDLHRLNPEMPGLAEMQNKVLQKLSDLREEDAALRAEHAFKQMDVDVDQRKSVPDSYGLRRFVVGETEAVHTPLTRMEEMLRTKISVHLEEVGLNDFILAVGEAENINIIADSMPDAGAMTLHADDVPLMEILEYVSRNLGVNFAVGENLIWATRIPSGQDPLPLQTRIYRLRKGISREELEGGANAPVIVEAITRFVPASQGADIMYDAKTHILLVKNTRENLTLVEEIIESLDVVPPQVLIEAHFIATDIQHLHELGIDWVLDSPWVVTRKKVPGYPKGITETEIARNADIRFSAFPSATGLNFTYRGILTDPQFQAVVHALETSGKSKTLSMPRITTLNNKEATIRIGEDFRYYEEYDVESTPQSEGDNRTVYVNTLVPVGTPQKEELGIKLIVRPSVGADMATIMLYIAPWIKEFVNWEYYETSANNSSSGNNSVANRTNVTSLVKIPIFKVSEMETQVKVNSGETVVMGGLMAAQDQRDEEGVPFLSSIPLIGRLFKHEKLQKVNKNLLIFVTATIVADTGEYMIPLTEFSNKDELVERQDIRDLIVED